MLQYGICPEISSHPSFPSSMKEHVRSQETWPGMHNWASAQELSQWVRRGRMEGGIACRALDPVASEGMGLLSKRKQTTALPHRLPQPFS